VFQFGDGLVAQGFGGVREVKEVVGGVIKRSWN
jgi:hypothetical protein